MSNLVIESFGITKSPLDAFRGRVSGITDNNAPLSIKQKEQKYFYALDIAGNNVPVSLKEGIDYELIPTITKKLSLTESQLGDLIKKTPTPSPWDLIKKERCPSPCPCKSEECNVEYLKEKVKFETLLSLKTPTPSPWDLIKKK